MPYRKYKHRVVDREQFESNATITNCIRVAFSRLDVCMCCKTLGPSCLFSIDIVFGPTYRKCNRAAEVQPVDVISLIV